MATINLTPEELDQQIIDCNTDESDDIVGASVNINMSGKVPHASLFVRFNNENKLVHYTGDEVLIDDADTRSNYYYKNLAIIPKELVPAFLAQCELICENAEPVYGFFYDGSLYDENGDFNSPGGNPEVMTCVGFCLNVIKSFIGEDNFLFYTDWDYTSLDEDDKFIDSFYQDVKKIRPSLTLNEFKMHIRRIYPLEYFTGAFYDEVNVRREFIDLNKNVIHNGLKSKRGL